MNNDLIKELRDIANDLDEVGRPRSAEIVDEIGLTVLAQNTPMTQEQAISGEQTIDPAAGQASGVDPNLLTMDPNSITDVEELRQLITSLQNAGKQTAPGTKPPMATGNNLARAINVARPNLT